MFKRFLLTLAVLALAACGESGPQPTATLPPVGVTLIAPTQSSNPPTLQPSNAPTTPPLAHPTTTPETVIGPETYPGGVNPLTGLPADPNALNRRPLAIKISNFPRYVRPQFGLSLADVVFEHYAEGGTTRFTAIFLGNDADKVGPIRSARLIDTVIPEMFNASLVASGSSSGIIHRLSFKDWFNVFIAEATGIQCPPLCRESEDTNSLYSNTKALHQILVDKGLDSKQPFRGVAYFSQPPGGGLPVSTARVEFSGEAFVEWRYTPLTGLYDRWTDAAPPISEGASASPEAAATDTAGTPIVQAPIIAPASDGLDNHSLTAANVVVLFVNHVVDFTIPEDFDTGGLTGHFSTEVQLWNTGPAWLLRDGQAYKLTWVRLDKSMVGLVDAENKIVPLKPGDTWYEIVGLTSETLTDGSSWLVRHKSPRDKAEIPGAPTLTPTVEGTPGEIPTETPTPSP
jgi:predicted small lipoprotein YifL